MRYLWLILLLVPLLTSGKNPYDVSRSMAIPVVFDHGQILTRGSAFLVEYKHKRAFITNAHVCLPAKKVNWVIYLYDPDTNTSYLSKILAYHSIHDLCMLKVPDSPWFKSMKPLEIAYEEPELGTDVASFGYPRNMLFTIHRGMYLSSPIDLFPVLSTKHICRIWKGEYIFNKHNKKWYCLVEIAMSIFTTTIEHGMSGGPLVNDQMEVVGVNAQVDAEHGVSYAVPVYTLWDFLEESYKEIK